MFCFNAVTKTRDNFLCLGRNILVCDVIKTMDEAGSGSRPPAQPRSEVRAVRIIACRADRADGPGGEPWRGRRGPRHARQRWTQKEGGLPVPGEGSPASGGPAAALVGRVWPDRASADDAAADCRSAPVAAAPPSPPDPRDAAVTQAAESTGSFVGRLRVRLVTSQNLRGTGGVYSKPPQKAARNPKAA